MVSARDRSREQMAGHGGFNCPPGNNAANVPDAVELGHAIVEPYRGRGYATVGATMKATPSGTPAADSWSRF